MLNFLSYSGSFRNLVDISFVCAMGPPGGGRNPITPRLARHFNYLSFTELEDSSKFKLAEREGEGGMLMSVYVRGGGGGGGCVRKIFGRRSRRSCQVIHSLQDFFHHHQCLDGPVPRPGEAVPTSC